MSYRGLLRLAAGLFAAAAISTAGAPPAAAGGEVNVYSYRQPFLVEPLFEAFTRESGIEVNVIYADGLIERMVQEGANSPADVLLAVDIGRLTSAVEQGVAQRLDSQVINSAIPATYRDPDGRWFGLTMRGRIVYASADRVEQETISYEELADPKWRGRICTRSGQHDYNIALIASMIAHHGEAAAKEWLEGLKNNLAHAPSGSDRAQVRSIHAGECDLAVGNTYYMALMRTNEEEPEQKDWAASAKILMPNAGDRGTHVNISGMVLASHAPNRDNAVALMEWLTGAEAQRIYAEVNHEYPLREGVPVSNMVASFGELKADALALSEIATHRKRASELVDEVDYDAGPSS
jgi:iron(III) transport system substrate-binding protein